MAQFTLDAHNRITAVALRGHAQSVREGVDPLCAAVSGIVTYAINTLREVKKLDIDVKANTPGDLTLSVKADSVGQAQDLLQGLRVQFSDYEKQYPDSVRVTVSQ